MVLAAAIGAALCYGVAMVLQQRPAAEVDPTASLRPRLLTELARRPVWLAGIAVNVAAFLLRLVALGRGSLVLVQPILVSGLVVALVIDAVTARTAVNGRDVAAAAILVAGVSTFLVSAAPTRGHTTAPLSSWLALTGVVAAIAVVAISLARRDASAGRRAASLAALGGILAVCTAALTKQAVAAFTHGHGLASWSPYAFVGATGLTVLVVQSAFQAGPLAASLPMLSVVEPLAGVAVGNRLFHERIATSAGARVEEVAGLLTLAAAGAVLAGSQGARAREHAVARTDHHVGVNSLQPRRIAVVPAYNEAPTVAAVLDRLAPLVDELVVVDDGSTDDTRAEIERWLGGRTTARLLSFDENQGMSAAYYLAFSEIRRRVLDGDLDPGDLVFTVDADGQHDLDVIDELRRITVDERLDALLVRRDLSTYPALKRLGNWTLSRWASLWAGSRLDDVESGYRVFRAGALCDALQYYKGYKYSETVEVAVVLCRLGYRVRNDVIVPVPIYRSRTSLLDAAIDMAAIPAAAWRVSRRRPRALAGDVAAAP